MSTEKTETSKTRLGVNLKNLVMLGEKLKEIVRKDMDKEIVESNTELTIPPGAEPVIP